MPTYDAVAAFLRDWDRLTARQQQRFSTRLSEFVADLLEMEAGRQAWFRPALRVKKIRSRRGVYEMTWAADGRATFTLGRSVSAGRLHVVWLRIGDHGILD